ncbi:MAG: GNAT family N-acetyltransferase [Thermoplasmata archaeon]|nr:GNAT family N-acetyltransferase [Thermoplasmata archaeon]
MPDSRVPDPRPDFRFRRLEKPEEFRAVEEVQAVAWGLQEEPPVPTPIQRAIQDNGGLVLGAFADVHLAGFCLGFLGWDGTLLYHYSHMTAVRPEYQNHRVGFRLKSHQREEVLGQGLTEIRWTFDPLQSRNAFLNVRRLGGTPDRYFVHYYGRMGSDANRDLETDRLRLVWKLQGPKVEERLAGKLPSPEEDLRRWTASVPILESEVGDRGLRIPHTVTEPEATDVNIEIPFDIALLREHEPESLRTWRHAVRDSFRAAFDLQYRVDDFAVVSSEHERRSIYLLSKATGTTSGPH